MLDVGVGVLWLVDRVSIKWERRSRDVSQPTWAVRVVACGIWGSVAETKILEWWSRNSKDKYWFTFGITLKLRVKIVGIPPKKGVTLTLEEWDNLNESFVGIDAEVRRLRCKNEQVDPVPPKGIKRHLQSTSGGEDEWVCGVFVLWMCAC